MKNSFLTFALLLFFHLANCQSFVLGIKAGVNRSSMSTSISNNAISEPNYGLVVGAFSRVGILGFFLQPEVQYNQRKSSVDLQNNQGASSQTLAYIDVPLLGGKSFLGLARVYAGPNFQFLLDASTSGASLPAFSQTNFNAFAIGGIAGAGLDIKKFSIDVRFDFSITDLGKKVISDSSQIPTSYNYSTRANMFQLTLGYKFIDL
jgi:hypothetical protein